MPENYVESENPFGSTTEASFFDQIATPPVEEKTEEPAPTEKEVATQASFFDQIATPSAEETEESAPAEKEIATGASFFDQIATPPVEEKTEIPAPTEKEVATEASFFDQIATPPVEEKSEEPAPAEEEVETSANPFTASEPSFFDEISTSTAKAPDAESTPAVGDTTLESSQVVPEAAPAEPVLSFPASGPSIFDNLGSSEATVEQKDSEEAGPSLSFENEPETSFFDQIGASEQNDSGEIHFDSAGATDDFLSSITPAAPTESSAPAHKDIEIVAEDSFDFLLEDDDFLSDEEPAPAPAATTKAPVQGRTSSYIPAAAVPSQPTSNYGGSVYNPAPYAASATGSITGASQTSQDAYKPKPFFSELPTLPQPKLMRRIEQYEQHAINHTTYAPPPPGPAANYMSNTPPPPGPAANYMSSTPPPAIIRSPPNQYAAPYTSPQQQQLLPAINPYAPVSSTAPSQVPQASYGSPQPAAAVPINPYAPMTTVSSPIKTAQKSINAFIPSPGTAFATLAPAETSQSNAYPAPANYTSPPPPAQSNYAPTVNNPYTPVATNAYAPSPSNAYAPSQPSMPAAAPVNNSYGAQQPPGGQYYGQPQAPPVAPPKTQPPRSQINSRGTDAYDPPFLPSTYAPPKRTVSQTWASNAPRASQAPPQGRPTPPPPRSNYSPQPENRQPAYPGMQSQQPAYTQGAPSQQYPPPPTGAYRPSSAVPPVQSTPPPMQHIPTAVQSTPPSVYGQAAASQHAPSGLSRASSYAPYSPPQNNNSQQSAAYLQTSPGSSFNGAKRSHTPRPNRSARPEPHPLVSWGANGRIATIFPTQNPQMAYTSTELDFTHSTIKMHNAKDVITDRAHDLVYTKFPGPLFHVASKSTNKSKKKEAAKWMESKIEELSKLVYDAVGADAKHEAEDKVSLWKCVKILLEHDYRFANNAEAIKEIRTALVPESADDSQVDEVGHFSSATDLYQRHVRNASSGSVEASGSVDTAKKIQALQKIRESLLKGNREAALMYSLDNKMWGHALLISNTISKERWTEAVHEFVQTEIKGIQTSEASSLAVVYNVFAGAGGEAVDSLLPPGMTVDLLPTASTRDQVPQDLLKWRETLAMIISNSSPPNDLDAILKLGTALERYGMTYAAHTCYIFTSAVFGAVDDPAASYTLLGADFSRNPSSFSKDLDAIVLSEIYELMVSQSDQVPAGTIYPHLQLFKYQHALMLSESGLVAEAKKYCEQILAGVKATPKTSFMYNSEFLVSVRELAARLSGVPDAEGKWLGGLVSKPTFGNMWGNIDKKLAQFVAGDDENASGNATASNKEGTDERFQKLASSPTLSRNQSVADLSAMGQSYYNNTGGAHSPSANASGMYNPRSHGSSPSSHRGNTSYSNYQDGYASDYPPVRPHSNPYAPRQESPNPYAPSTAAVDIPRSNYSQNAYEPTGSSYDSQPRMQPDYSRPGSAYSYRPASSQGGRSSALAPLTAVKPAENYSKPPTPASGTQGPPSRPAFQSRRSSYDSNNAYDPTRASSGYEPPKPTYEAPENDEYSELNHRSGYGDDELSGYPSYGEEATTEDRNESYDPEGGVSSGYQPPEMTYEPPTPTYEPEAETEEQAEEEPSPKMPEMPSYGYGYEPPSYEPMIGGPVMGDYGSSSYEPPEQEPESGGYNGGYMPPDPEDNAGDYENGHGGHNGNNDRYDDGFDDDDLGIGNSSLRKKKAPKDDGEQKEEKEDKKEEEKKEEKNGKQCRVLFIFGLSHS
ncbi:Sec23-binding domain of Sec16-domain-containing protein [Myxozyma melibiosi]|uniref:Protein transport protein sec16 n=1 Tax=Myxozyma melibiosi TaxID=54550 RepID=A0ABR1F432_9ASCO